LCSVINNWIDILVQIARNKIIWCNTLAITLKTCSVASHQLQKGIGMAKTFLSSDVKIDGQVKSNSDIEIDGEVKGQIQATAIKILNSGKVEGTVQCDSLAVEGELSGTVGVNDLNISSTGIVLADVQYSSLTTAKGAKLQGQLKVK